MSDIPYTISDLLIDCRKRFANTLRDLCEAAGLSQGELSRKIQADAQHLGLVGEDTQDFVGSLAQPTISRILAGKQSPTYCQLYLFLRAIRAHYHSPELARQCQEHELPVPVFSGEQEQTLWRLAGFAPPEQRAQELAKPRMPVAFVAFPPRHVRGWIGARDV